MPKNNFVTCSCFKTLNKADFFLTQIYKLYPTDRNASLKLFFDIMDDQNQSTNI